MINLPAEDKNIEVDEIYFRLIRKPCLARELEVSFTMEHGLMINGTRCYYTHEAERILSGIKRKDIHR